MALFGKNNGPKINEGGLMDVIRCDEQDYLIWKWRPRGEAVNSTRKENAVRFGSQLHIKSTEQVVFSYKGKYDFIQGPYDGTVKSANLPVLSSILGVAFGGAAPFTAEIYFINQANVQKMNFAIPYFKASDYRFPDIPVDVSIHGTLTYKIDDPALFIENYGLVDFDVNELNRKLKSTLTGIIKPKVNKISRENQIPLVQIDTMTEEVNEIVGMAVKERIKEEVGITVKYLDLTQIEFDETSDAYMQLKSATADLSVDFAKNRNVNKMELDNAQFANQAADFARDTKLKDANAEFQIGQAKINLENMSEVARINREEAQRAQKYTTESNFMQAHIFDKQAEVAAAAANAMGGAGTLGAGGINPAGIMAGMAIGGAFGQNVGGMMNNMTGGFVSQAQNVAPPPPPVTRYNIAVNGATTGPYDMQTLAQMAQTGQFTKESLVWKAGMQSWAQAGTIAELSQFFVSGATPVPPPPPPAQ